MHVRVSHVLAVALSTTAAVGAISVARADAPAGPVVVRDTQASTDTYGATLAAPVQPNTEIEPSIAVNPADPRNVVSAFQVGRVDAGGDADNGFATSFDSGQTWTYGNLPSITKSAPGCPNANLPGCAFDRASDAVVTFGADPANPGHYLVYVSSLVFDDTSANGLPSGMAVNVSKDGGATWSDGVILEQDSLGGLNDKNWIVVDNGSGAGHHPGRVYVVWDRVVPIVYSYCDPDHAFTVITGKGCDKLANWSNANGNGFYVLFPGQGIGTMPVVLNDGSLGVIFNSLTSNPCPPPANPTDQPNCVVGGSNIEWGRIPAAGSAVWPANFAPTTFAPVTIANYESNGVTGQRAGTLPQVAYDATRNEVFVCWEDNRFRTDGGTAAGSGLSNHNDAVIAYSQPDITGVPGLTWSSPVRVNNDATGDFIDHYNTTIAVGQDGILRVAYRQRYEPANFDPASAFYPIDTYYQESNISTPTSASFSTPLRADLGQNTVNPQFGAFSRNGLFNGDYEQIAAGATDQSYITRDEAFAGSASTCTTGFLNPQPCQNQQTWVAFLAPPPGTQTPETRFIPALVVAGIGAAALVWRRRRTRAGSSLTS